MSTLVSCTSENLNQKGRSLLQTRNTYFFWTSKHAYCSFVAWRWWRGVYERICFLMGRNFYIHYNFLHAVIQRTFWEAYRCIHVTFKGMYFSIQLYNSKFMEWGYAECFSIPELETKWKSIWHSILVDNWCTNLLKVASWPYRHDWFKEYVYSVDKVGYMQFYHDMEPSYR